MHSSGEVGAQLRHWASRAFGESVRLRLVPLWEVWRTLVMFVLLTCVKVRKELWLVLLCVG